MPRRTRWTGPSPVDGRTAWTSPTPRPRAAGRPSGRRLRCPRVGLVAWSARSTYAPGYWPGQLPPSSDFAPLRRNATMTQAQMAHAQWEASRAAPVQVSSYTAATGPTRPLRAESYDFGHALQRPAVQQQHPGYGALSAAASVSLDPSRTPPPRLNPGSPAFAPRSPPAVGGRARARTTRTRRACTSMPPTIRSPPSTAATTRRRRRRAVLAPPTRRLLDGRLRR